MNHLAIVMGRMLCKIFNLTFYSFEAGAAENALESACIPFSPSNFTIVDCACRRFQHVIYDITAIVEPKRNTVFYMRFK